jgi:hypothetical protein
MSLGITRKSAPSEVSSSRRLGEADARTRDGAAAEPT